MAKPKPTGEAYGELQSAYDFFNRELFGNELPDCLMTLQRKSVRVLGYFSPQRFIGAEGDADELAMNPAHFHVKSIEDVLSTLVHEQAHVWQQYHGTPGRRGYHNKEWGEKMKAIGLHPSRTGAPGGKQTGDRMHHFIVEGGKFDVSCKRLLGRGFRLTWAETAPKLAAGLEGGAEGLGEAEQPKKDKSNRLKYTCTGCGLNAWGKPGILLVCGKCRVDLVQKGIE